MEITNETYNLATLLIFSLSIPAALLVSSKLASEEAKLKHFKDRLQELGQLRLLLETELMSNKEEEIENYCAGLALHNLIEYVVASYEELGPNRFPEGSAYHLSAVASSIRQHVRAAIRNKKAAPVRTVKPNVGGVVVDIRTRKIL